MKQGANNFCGARLNKIKSFKVMSYKQGHNFREADFEFGDNVNLDLSHLNNTIFLNGFENDLITTYNKFLKKCKKKPRKDHIKAFEYLFYRSDCFNTQEEYELYKKQTVEFIKAYFKDCPVCIVEHNDEKIQHFHVFVIPCTYSKEKDDYEFNGSQFCDKKKKLADLQTEYAKYCQICGLRRGRERSYDKHLDIAKFYDEENKKLIEYYETLITKKENDYKEVYDYVNEQIEYVSNISQSLDDEIAQKRVEGQIETLQKYKDSTITYFKQLDEMLKDDDGSDFFKGIRACFEYLKNLLIEAGVSHRNQEKNVNH